MKIKGHKAAITAVIFLLMTSISFAAVERIELKGEFWQKSRGEAVIKDTALGKKEVSIEVRGLKPNETYTVWLANKDEKSGMKGLGAGDFSFKSDSNGMGRYTATVSEDDLSNWERIAIARQPEGKTSEGKDMDIALKGDLIGPQDTQDRGIMEERRGEKMERGEER